MDYSYINLPAPQLINKPKSDEDLFKRIRSSDYFGEVKKDGCLYQLVKDIYGNVFLFSRTISKKTGFYVDKIENVPHIKNWAKYLPNDTILLGEVYYPEKTSKDVITVMGALPQKAIARQDNNPIHYYVYDVLRYNGRSFLDKTNIERFEILNRLDVFENGTDWLELARPYYTNLDKVLDKVFSDGEEGMVFKLKSGLYKPGKRPTYNIKAKTEDSIDAIITGFVKPERDYTGKELEIWPYWIKRDIHNIRLPLVAGGYYRDYINNPNEYIPVTKAYYYNWNVGFIVSLMDEGGVSHDVANVTSGLTDFMREDSAKRPESYLLKIAEVKCMSIDKDAMTLRHPRFVKLRNDKNPKDCTLKNVMR